MTIVFEVELEETEYQEDVVYEWVGRETRYEVADAIERTMSVKVAHVWVKKGVQTTEGKNARPRKLR